MKKWGHGGRLWKGGFRNVKVTSRHILSDESDNAGSLETFKEEMKNEKKKGWKSTESPVLPKDVLGVPVSKALQQCRRWLSYAASLIEHGLHLSANTSQGCSREQEFIQISKVAM